MFKYVKEMLFHEICPDLCAFLKQKSERWTKPGSKFLFFFLLTYQNQSKCPFSPCSSEYNFIYIQAMNDIWTNPSVTTFQI